MPESDEPSAHGRLRGTVVYRDLRRYGGSVEVSLAIEIKRGIIQFYDEFRPLDTVLVKF